MRIILLLVAAILLGGNLQAGVSKTFPNGFILCVFDHPATMINHGSKLVIAAQHPTNHRWAAPNRDLDVTTHWISNYLSTGSSGDEVDSEGTLTIKRPVTVAFCNFKGGEIEVEFSAMPKRIRRLQKPPWQ